MPRRPLILVALLVLGAGLLSACGPVAYLSQAAAGQLSLLRDARPISQVLLDPTTPPDVREKLQLVVRVRDFAHQELGLPEHGAFRNYVDLRRPFVVWNVFSAPEFSTALDTSCFPVVGCVSYQGYFSEDAAQHEGERRRAAGRDVLVGGVKAYSTLGYLKDPLLSSMLSYSQPQLIRTVIHELAHPSLYVPGDTVFSESYATAIEEEGMRRWLARYGTPDLRVQDDTEQQQQREWQTLLLAARTELNALYAQPLSDPQKREQKTRILDDLQHALSGKLATWRGYTGGAAAPRQNNASLGAVAAYADLVPDFQKLLGRVQGDLPAFMREAKKCAEQPKDARASCLRGE